MALSVTARHRLACFFATVAEVEGQVDVQRALLAHQKAFTPHKAFAALDPHGNGFLTSGDLQRYLRQYGVVLTEFETYTLLRRLDTNGDGKVSYSEFLDYVLPSDFLKREQLLHRDKGNPFLRFPNSSSCYCDCCCCKKSREACCVCNSGGACLYQLLQREVEAQRLLESRRRALAESLDFRLLAAFQFAEDPSCSAVTPMSLAEALAREGFALTHLEQQLIFRRLDSDKDGRLKYLEFVEALMPSSCSAFFHASEPAPEGHLSCMCSSGSSRHRSHSHSFVRKSNSCRLALQQQSSMIRSSSSSLLCKGSHRAADSEAKRYCPNIEFRCGGCCSGVFSECMCTSRLLREAKSKLPPCKANFLSPSNNAVATRCEVAGVLTAQIDNERRLEYLREKLALKPDFNLLQFWGLFDTEGRGYATAVHVQNAFNAVGLDISLPQARLFASKLNSDAEPCLKYADMARAFLPTRTKYAEAMLNRISNGSHKCPAPLKHLAPETLELVASIFDLTLVCEEQAELSRHRLCLKDLSSAFHDLDKNGDGYVTASEFSASLRTHGFCPSEAELNALVSRYDKNGDGKVSYTEFVNEIGRTRCPVGCCRLVCLCP